MVLYVEILKHNQTNTTKTEINLKSLKWDTDYSYYLTSLTEDGIEGYRIYDKYDFKNNEDYFMSIYFDQYYLHNKKYIMINDS